MSSNSSISITGGAGYLGSVLVDELHDKGDDFQAIDNFHTGAIRPGAHLVKADIRNPPPLGQTVIHLAALRDGECKASPKAARSVNVEGTRAVIKAAEASKARTFILASSCSLYGWQGSKVDETSSLKPTSAYGMSKVAAEQLVRASIISTRVILRFATLYGASPCMRTDTLFNQLVMEAIKDGKLTIYESQAWRPLLHVKDAAKAIMKATTFGMGLFVINVGFGNYTKSSLAAMVLRRYPKVKLTLDKEIHDKRSYQVSFERMHRFIGYAKTSPELAIKEIEDSL